MKVILTDNASNHSHESVYISFCLQKTWNKSFERDMFLIEPDFRTVNSLLSRKVL